MQQKLTTSKQIVEEKTDRRSEKDLIHLQIGAPNYQVIQGSFLLQRR
jgi:hypothetical protein